MNFAEASGYLQNAGREKAWEAVCIGLTVHTSRKGVQQQPAHSVLDLRVQTVPAFSVSFDCKPVNVLPSLHTAPPNSNCFLCKNPFWFQDPLHTLKKTVTDTVTFP